jgi:hypothetical protein
VMHVFWAKHQRSAAVKEAEGGSLGYEKPNRACVCPSPLPLLGASWPCGGFCNPIDHGSHQLIHYMSSEFWL